MSRRGSNRKFGWQSGIVAQWADAHNSLAQAWVTADPTHAAYIDAWAKEHPDVVAQFVKDNPDKPQPKASDLAVVFFEHFSKDHPGMFPSPVTHPGADGKDVTEIQPVEVGSDIQSIFFEMWRDDHPDAPLQDVPGDYVTTSGSGLDPDITLQNAEFQLDRVAGRWAQDLKRNPVEVRNEIEQMLQARVFSPGGGLFGEPVVNVLEMNLDLRKDTAPRPDKRDDLGKDHGRSCSQGNEVDPKRSALWERGPRVLSWMTTWQYEDCSAAS